MDDLFQLLDEHRSRQRAAPWEGTFRDYLQLVAENPKIARRLTRGFTT